MARNDIKNWAFELHTFTNGLILLITNVCLIIYNQDGIVP